MENRGNSVQCPIRWHLRVNSLTSALITQEPKHTFGLGPRGPFPSAPFGMLSHVAMEKTSITPCCGVTPLTPKGSDHPVVPTWALKLLLPSDTHSPMRSSLAPY